MSVRLGRPPRPLRGRDPPSPDGVVQGERRLPCLPDLPGLRGRTFPKSRRDGEAPLSEPVPEGACRGAFMVGFDAPQDGAADIPPQTTSQRGEGTRVREGGRSALVGDDHRVGGRARGRRGTLAEVVLLQCRDLGLRHHLHEFHRRPSAGEAAKAHQNVDGAHPGSVPDAGRHHEKVVLPADHHRLTDIHGGEQAHHPTPPHPPLEGPVERGHVVIEVEGDLVVDQVGGLPERASPPGGRTQHREGTLETDESLPPDQSHGGVRGEGDPQRTCGRGAAGRAP